MTKPTVRLVLCVALVAAVIAVVVLVVVALPTLVYPEPKGLAIDLKTLTADEKLALLTGRQQSQASLRTALVQTLGGTAIALGTVLAWRQFRHAKREAVRQADEKREDFHLDLFTEAIKSLSTDRADTRIAGLHALSRLAELSVAHRPATAEVMSAFVRSRSPWPPQPPRPDELAPVSADTGRSLRDYSPDVQTALTLLGQHTYLWHRVDYVRLRHIDLRKANLSGGHYEGYAFTESHLDGAWLKGADFNGASFRGASLVNAQLDNASLERCNIRGANFTGASMREVRLAGAIFDNETRWPGGFSDEDAFARGARLPQDASRSTAAVPEGVVEE